jgi:CPA1 family monovalent cation:H+ antiporter
MENSLDIYLQVVLGISLSVLGASALYIFASRLKAIPYPVLLVAVGLILAPFAPEPLEAIRLNPGSVLFIFLPILLYESAYSFKLKELREIMVPGFLFASVGLVISAVVVALFFNLLFHLPFLESLLFGAVISSTDPIAVLSIFKQLGVPKRLQLLVDAESFLNDGTSVIMFRIIIAILGGGALYGFGGKEIVDSFGNFAVVLFGGLAVGVAFGYLFAHLIAPVKNVSSVEIALTIILAHLVFIVADHYLHVSGILAVLGAGVVMGNYGESKISPKVVKNMHLMWEFLVFITTSLVFLLIGYEINIVSLIRNFDLVLVLVLALFIGRSICVYGLGFLYNLFAQKRRQLPLSWLHIANWGGLRGALPLVMLLSLPDSFVYKAVFIEMVLGAILFTMLVNALSIKTLIKVLGLDKLATADKVEIKLTQVLLLQNLLKQLQRLKATGEIGEATFNKHQKQLNITLKEAEAELNNWLSDKSPEEYALEVETILLRYCLQLERSLYRSLYGKGVINENIYLRLKSNCELQVEHLNAGSEEFNLSDINVGSEILKLHSITGRYKFAKVFSRVLGNMAVEQKAKVIYTLHKARLLGNEKVIEELEQFALAGLAVLQEKTLSRVIAKYQKLLKHNQEILAALESSYPVQTLQAEEEFYMQESTELVSNLLHKLGEDERISRTTLNNLAGVNLG